MTNENWKVVKTTYTPEGPGKSWRLSIGSKGVEPCFLVTTPRGKTYRLSPCWVVFGRAEIYREELVLDAKGEQNFIRCTPHNGNFDGLTKYNAPAYIRYAEWMTPERNDRVSLIRVGVKPRY